jgi:hypothetical protein
LHGHKRNSKIPKVTRLEQQVPEEGDAQHGRHCGHECDKLCK